MAKKIRIFKRLYLGLRSAKLSVFSAFTSSMRKKKFNKESSRSVFVVSMKRIGDAVLSIPTFRAIKESIPKSLVTVYAEPYILDILERIPSIDAIIPCKKGSSFLKKARQVRKLTYNSFDLAVDLTCDYTMEGALWTLLSGAKYRVGYDTRKRGFLFNRPVKHEPEGAHIIDEILAIVKSIGLETRDKSLSLTASKEAEETIKKLLREKGAKSGEKLIGIHPGGHYITQRWLPERFAEVADKLIKKHRARIILMGGPKEEKLIAEIKASMTQLPITVINQPLGNLLALIQTCQLLICNNSGPLHMATAVGTPTVSTMGPTIPKRWWPRGAKHQVIRKNLPCMPCNEGYCRLKTLDCMKSITVEDMLEAVEHQISRIKKSRK
ncbi:MAG: glycosyltransferase family 9 protein [Candidatus Aminicenantes bacterium]|nr:glycosyltransferase family 9 protein [Candidatus Aminicenantes bacterium]MDH5704740.1 glycosyltransferase family 9 protein [Candidatus Aminicenantes bacterium]